METYAQDWAKQFRGRNSGSHKALAIMQEIHARAAFFLYRLPREQQDQLGFQGDPDIRGGYVFTAGFDDGSWLVADLSSDPYIRTRARVANRRQVALLEGWYGSQFDPWKYVSARDRQQACEEMRQSRPADGHTR